MTKEDFLEGLSNVYAEGAIGNTLMREFSERKSRKYQGIYASTYYVSFTRLSVYLENKYGITKVKLIQNHHVYEWLEYMRSEGFKPSTLKGYITAVRQVYDEKKHLFSAEFVLPSNAEFEQYRKKSR